MSHHDDKSNIIRNFAPGWYASVMGTAVIVIDIFAFQDAIPLAQVWQLLFLALSGIMLVVISVPWTLRWFLYFDDVWQDLQHPVSAAFFPTMPISLIVWGIALEKAGPLFLPEATVHAVMQVLWLLGTVGIGIFAVLILNTYFYKEDMQWKMANLGWLIPPVSALIVPVLGGSLSLVYADAFWGPINFYTSLIYLGTGALLFLFVTATVFSRYLFHELPPGHLAPTIWIGIAPTAILAITALKFVKPLVLYFQATEEAAKTLAVMAKAAGVGLWGFAFFWLVLALVLVVLHHQQKPLPFAMSWWAFTFPSGAFVVATGVVYKAVHAPFFQAVGLLGLAGFLIVWAVVSWQTLRRVVSGEIFVKHGG